MCRRDSSVYESLYSVERNQTIMYNGSSSDLKTILMLQPTDLPPKELLFFPQSGEVIQDYANVLTD